jgi:hypothetical protein
MPFDPSIFEAEVALKLIPTEQLPLRAQDALEVGFDRPHTLRVAILEPKSLYEIEQALPNMLSELGLEKIKPEEAAIRLAAIRAKQLLDSGDDPIPSLSYFYRLLTAGNCPDDLYELAYLGDEWEFTEVSPEEQQKQAIEALENLLFPELREQRRAKRQAEWQRLREEAKLDWPYIFRSTTGSRLLKDRYKERLIELRPVLVIEAAAWALVGWALGSWKTPLIGYIITVPLLMLLAYWGVYRQLKRERRDTLLRLGVPDNQI